MKTFYYLFALVMLVLAIMLKYSGPNRLHILDGGKLRFKKSPVKARLPSFTKPHQEITVGITQ
jgi:hypothetical protein